MRVDLFDFDLPDALIALRPVSLRDAARLLVVRPGIGVEDRIVRDLPDLLSPGDCLVLNNTRVIPAELSGVRERGESAIAFVANLHKRAGPDAWWAFARPGKRLKIGDTLRFGDRCDAAGMCELGELFATVAAKGEGGDILFRFDRAGAALDTEIARIGTTPLPPYISGKRQQDAADISDYQTVYAREDGSVAAPTAGLHMTEDLMARLVARGVQVHHLTLHVGAGTFLPVKAEDTRDHTMHSEWGHVAPETAYALNAARAAGGRIVALGTTSLRLLESAADETGMVHPFAAETSIFITPGYQFRAIDAVVTNFHLPKSTLFMLVSAFSGLETMRAAYAHAIASGYRFYSYGDASLLFPERPR